MPKMARNSKQRSSRHIPQEMRLACLSNDSYSLVLVNCAVDTGIGYNLDIAATRKALPSAEHPELEIHEPTKDSPFQNLRLQSKNNGTALLFKKRIVVVGMKSIEDPPFWESVFEKLGLEKLQDRWWSNANKRVFTGNLGTNVNLGKLAASFPDLCKYNPGKFSGCRVSATPESRNFISVFHSGLINVFLTEKVCEVWIWEMLDKISNFKEYHSSALRSDEEELARVFKEKLQISQDYAPDLTLSMSSLTLDETAKYVSDKMPIMQKRAEEYEYWKNKLSA